MTELVDVAALLVAVVLVQSSGAYVSGKPMTAVLKKPHAPPMSTRDETTNREVRRRRDGVVVVREDDPETGETIERKYPACPVHTAVMRGSPGR